MKHRIHRYRRIEPSVGWLVAALLAALLAAAISVGISGCAKPGPVPVPVRPTPIPEDAHCSDECPCPGCAACINGKCLPPVRPEGGER